MLTAIPSTTLLVGKATEGGTDDWKLVGRPWTAVRCRVISLRRFIGDKAHEQAARADLRDDASRDTNYGYSTRHIPRDHRPRAHGYVVADSCPAHDAGVSAQKDAVSEYWILAADLTKCDTLMDSTIRPHPNSLVYDNRPGVGDAEPLSENVRGNREAQPFTEEIHAKVEPEFHDTANRVVAAIEPILVAPVEPLIVAHPPRNQIVPAPVLQSLGRKIGRQIGPQVSTRTDHALIVPVIAINGLQLWKSWRVRGRAGVLAHRQPKRIRYVSAQGIADAIGVSPGTRLLQRPQDHLSTCTSPNSRSRSVAGRWPTARAGTPGAATAASTPCPNRRTVAGRWPSSPPAPTQIALDGVVVNQVTIHRNTRIACCRPGIT